MRISLRLWSARHRPPPASALANRAPIFFAFIPVSKDEHLRSCCVNRDRDLLKGRRQETHALLTLAFRRFDYCLLDRAVTPDCHTNGSANLRRRKSGSCRRTFSAHPEGSSHEANWFEGVQNVAELRRKTAEPARAKTFDRSGERMAQFLIVGLDNTSDT